jgi:predicted lysophospholipase L1 biosynthesis ABC-type transport system permease subunit
MAISTILALLFGLVTAFFAAVYCFMPDMIVRQINETARRTPKLLHFALPIQPREGRITVRQVRSTGLGLFLISAWFLLVAILSILGH